MFRIPLTNRNNFYYSLLSSKEKSAYLQCIDGLSNGRLKIKISTPIDTESEIENIMTAINYDIPELFFLDYQMRVWRINDDATMTLTSKYPIANVQNMWHELNSRINEAVDFANEKSEPYQKILAVNEFLCNEVKYRNDDKSSGNAWGALVDGFARCEGISKAAKLILERLGFEVLLPTGEVCLHGISEPHAWNIVKYEGDYYNFDFTQNIGGTLYSIPCTDWLFLTDDDLRKTHISHTSNPQCANASNTSWARNNNFASCSADFARLTVDQYDSNFYATVKLEMDITEQELNERIPYWFTNELSGYSYGRGFAYSFNDFLNVLTFYMLNEIK